MPPFGFCGGSYTSQSVNVEAQRTINWYPESTEGHASKTRVAMYPTPGSHPFVTLSGPSVRVELTINGRMFAVSGVNFYEVFANQTFTNFGNVLDDGLPASIIASAQQVLIAAGGTLYVFTLATNAFQTLGAPVNVGMVGFSDGFFIALIRNSAQFFVSSPLDATTWPGASTAIVSVFPDNVLSTIVDHREIWLFGLKATIVYYNSGNVFPYDVVPGGFIEQGCAAQFSPVKLDNTIFWIGGDERGNAVAWRAQGYTPTRISTHAVEFAWQSYATVSDAVAYSYQDQGHAFWVIYFPTANATWVYDAATGMWHERAHLVAATGFFEAHRSQCHTFAFGKHLVGDWGSGKIYNMSIAFNDDIDGPLRRVRRAPHVSVEQQWEFHSQLQVDLETGLGPQPPLLDGAGNPRDPQANLRWSDDGGHTWSNIYTVDAGQAGQFRKRVIWRRLGRSRDRVYEFSVSDPIPWRIVDAYLNVGT